MRMFTKLTPIRNLHLNSELKVADNYVQTLTASRSRKRLI
jgi:hypothetical protein